ncbi:DUF2723 domain-containing protein [Flavobacterium jejuense]|uniref:DUF2723 domain-containing protein n=1 Tax=Flavobacterium jejuense TaxID=1544455 RepID=A0ABX0ITE8_9FLAO|nr:DUF2723 domain-containing protein [Flavobacterium jejuense]NHN27062.1 DUF2723 domain-containing protein [Flavobacterium jejuense]
MKKIEKAIELLLFVFVFVIYTFSVSKTITFWDSSEFVTTNYHLQSSHPPGAPFYTLLCNFILLFFPVSWAALVSNLISAFFGALTILFVYKIVKLIVLNLSSNNILVALISGIISALTLAFSDTFWSASIEAEVYTLSTFLLVLSFYLMLLWHTSNSSIYCRKLLLFIVFIMGISIGVHLINLAILIPLSILYIHKRKGLDWKYILGTFCGSILLFLFVYSFGIQGFLKIASKIDIWLVNSYSLPVNSGLIFLMVLFLVVIFVGLFQSYKKGNTTLNTFLLAVLFFATGTSSYLMPIMRNNTITPFSNQMESTNELLKYIQAKQFGVDNIPLIKGKVFNAPLDKDFPFLNNDLIYTYNSDSRKYEIVDDGKFSKINYAHEFDMYFPRMYSQKPVSVSEYSNWVTIKGEKVVYPVRGKEMELLKPTFSENLIFFKNYQVDWMYLRYLYWNFIGKQNEIKGTGTILNGNWQSGIDFIDKSRIGDSSVIPERYNKDKSNDVYYFLPFILGIIGLWSLRKSRVYLISTIVFFLTFGIGITIYLNPLPESILIRERDYVFLGSFIVFSIWIGLSVITLNEWLSKIKSEKIRIAIILIVVMLFSPLQLVAKNWDNHQRSNDTFIHDLAKSYLNSCPQNTILITNGDNFTFPLWYLQEVENFRNDVRVINYDQLNIASYIDKLKFESLSSSVVKMSFFKGNYREGTPKLFPLKNETDKPIDVESLFQFLNDEKTKINWNGKQQHYIPGNVFSITLDTTKTVFSSINLDKLNASFNSKIIWKNTKDFYQLNDLVVLSLIQENINDRPICFLVNGNNEHYIGLQNNLIHKGFVEQLVPISRTNKNLNPKIVDVEKGNSILKDEIFLKALNNEDLFIKSESKEYIQVIVRRNYYFLAQALIEEGKSKEAKQVLDKCMISFPDKTIPFKQYAFALGKLYCRIGEKTKGTEICLLSIKNSWEELQWITSFNPKNNPIINVKKATQLKEIYQQMILQLEAFNPEAVTLEKQKAIEFTTLFTKWQIKNWPY